MLDPISTDTTDNPIETWEPPIAENLSSLPPEVVAGIFIKLESLQDVNSLAAVSTDCNHVAHISFLWTRHFGRVLNKRLATENEVKVALNALLPAARALLTDGSDPLNLTWMGKVVEVIAKDRSQLWIALRDSDEEISDERSEDAFRAWSQAHMPRLQQITDLTLTHVKLLTVPREVRVLANLTEIDLVSCGLRHIGPEIGELTGLRRLNVQYNQLKRLPDELGKCSQLRELWATRNALRSLPDSLSELTELRVIHIEFNQLQGPLPPVDRWQQIEELWLRSNPLTAIPVALKRLEGKEATQAEGPALNKSSWTLFE